MLVLAVGVNVDAKDSEGIWYEARIVEYRIKSVKVTYRAWSSAFDEVIQDDEYSSRLALPYTYTNNWRKELKIGSEFHYLIKNESGIRLWYPAVVSARNREDNTIRFIYMVSDNSLAIRGPVLSVSSDQICPHGTHVVLMTKQLFHALRHILKCNIEKRWKGRRDFMMFLYTQTYIPLRNEKRVIGEENLDAEEMLQNGEVQQLYDEYYQKFYDRPNTRPDDLPVHRVFYMEELCRYIALYL